MMKSVLNVLNGFLFLTLAVIGLPGQGHAASFATSLDCSPVGSPGSGFATIDLNTLEHRLEVNVTFADLLGTTTVAHIHGPTASPGTGDAGVITQVPSFPGFPAGVTNGTYSNTFDTQESSTWNPSFLGDNGFTPLEAEAALASYLAEGRAYLNIHTDLFPAGEIRGFFAAVAVPEPAGFSLFSVGMIGSLGFLRRWRSGTRL